MNIMISSKPSITYPKLKLWGENQGIAMTGYLSHAICGLPKPTFWVVKQYDKLPMNLLQISLISGQFSYKMKVLLAGRLPVGINKL